MTRSSAKGAALAAIIAAVAAIQGCGDPPPARRNDLSLGEDDATGKSKKRSSGADEAPEGTTPDSIELGAGTRGTEPNPERARSEGDGTTAKDAPASCTTDAQCNLPGRICTAGECVKGCRSTAGCPTNQVCEQSQCRFDDANVECYWDYDCEYGAICIADECVPGCHSSYDCPTGQTCSAGQCKVVTLPATPPQCVSDGQCNPGINGSGKICSAQGACVPGCHRDNQCPGTKICVSGSCR